jgi:hypothetical protein
MERLNDGQSEADVLLCTFENTTAGFASLPPRGNFCMESNYSSPRSIVSLTKPCSKRAVEKSKEDKRIVM